MTLRVVLREPQPGDDPARSAGAWLKPGVSYDVLEVRAEPGRLVHLRIAGEQSGTPALFDAALFDTVDGTIPPHWRARLGPGGTLTLGPEAWAAPGFWEAYFDDDPDAVAAYERGRAAG
jgi:hypothetical protein